MLVRLVIAVLTLAGPLPGRVCTCAAGKSLPHTELTHRAKGCHCQHRSATHRTVTALHDHTDGHHHDCPVVNPRPPVVAEPPELFDSFDLHPVALVPLSPTVSDSTSPAQDCCRAPVRAAVPLHLRV